MSKENTTCNFENQVFYIGIDVHKSNWSISIRTNNMLLKTFSMNPDPKQLSYYMNQHYPRGIYKSVYEAGFCGFVIHYALLDCGFDNIVTHAADVPTTHKEKVTKSDKVDSRKLAKELEHKNLKAIYVPSIERQQLRSLCRLRHREASHMTRLKNRIKGHMHYYGITLPPEIDEQHWSAKFITFLESRCDKSNPAGESLLICLEEVKMQRQRISSLTRSLRRHLLAPESDSATIMRCLLSIPGIGFVTAATIYTEIIDIRRFSKFDHLASFVGLSPACHSSGEKDITTGITPRKNRYLRHLIIEAAWIASRKDPVLLQSLVQLSSRMKKSKAIVRIAKKLLSRIKYVWENQKEYQCLIN